MDFAAKLGALMAARDMSGCALARLVPCDRALICRYRSGKQAPSARMARRIDEVLGAGGDLAALAGPGRRTVLAGLATAAAIAARPPLLGPLDVDGRERLARAAANPARADQAVVDSLGELLASVRHAEDVLGSAAMLRPALAQLSTIERLVRQARGQLRPAMLNVGQQWAQFAGWLCRDTGDTAGARACLSLATEWAAELGARTMISTVLAVKSEMAADEGQIDAMIGLAQGAQHDISAATGQRADAAGLEARGYGMAGDAVAAESKLRDARELAAALAARPQDQRPWAYWMNEAVFRNEEGITCAYLAGNSSRWYERAVDLLAPGPGETALWAAAKNLTWLTLAHARAGDVGQACATGIEAAQAVRRTGGSAQHVARLIQISTELHAGCPADPQVADFAAALG